MNVFAGYGFDVWTMDHENYGKSSRTGSNSDIASGAEDLKAGIDLILVGDSLARRMSPRRGLRAISRRFAPHSGRQGVMLAETRHLPHRVVGRALASPGRGARRRQGGRATR